MPDYEWKLWSLENFDLASAPQFVRDAVKARKWAFAADYIRMYALYTEGGFYLDSDVKVLKRFDDFLDYQFISSVEHHPVNWRRPDRSMPSQPMEHAKGKSISPACRSRRLEWVRKRVVPS